MRKDRIEDYVADLPDGKYALMVDRVELRLSTRMMPCLTIHFIITDGIKQGVYIYKRAWLNTKVKCCYMGFTFMDMGIGRKDYWTEAELNQALAGKKITGEIVTKGQGRHERRDIVLPTGMTPERKKILDSYWKEIR